MKLSLVLFCCAVTAAPLAAQEPAWDPGSANVTRAELQEMLARFEATANSSTYGGGTRARARAEADMIRQRLAEGDIRVGDRIALRVEHQVELSDTFPVLDGPVILLPTIGEIPVGGVLRSELQPHLATQIARFVRDPSVHARALIRLEIMGAVGQPGFHTVPSDILISDALMLAGGPSGDAELNKMKIRRGDRVIWEGDRLREAVVAGRTLDQLNLRAGDAVELPLKKSILERIAPVTGIVGAIGSLTWIVIRVLR